jgi:eukaryotic-like serine/threonine-protein kinase
MPPRIVLSVTKGNLKGQEFTFEERNTAILGRAADCQVRLPDDEHHKTASRHHCLLDVNPPDIRIRDFGSLNGTHLNGTLIGKREPGTSPEEGAKITFREHDLKEGDEITLGDTLLKVSIYVPACCAECTKEIAEHEKDAAERAPGVFQCSDCRKKAERQGRKEPPKKKPKRCDVCGREVAEEVGEHRQGTYVCLKCKKNPLQIVKRLLGLAKSGAKELQTIGGYEIVKELGQGGMGAVYLARHESSGDQVALKVMLPKVAANEKSKEMFLREIENTKALKHRNVVQLRDAGFSHGTYFFTLEYCDGGSVDLLMKQRGGPLSMDEAVPIVLQALEGLDYAHHAEIPQVKLANGEYGPGKGLVHRDIKPHNLFLTGSERSPVAKVGDYGLAKAFDLAGLSGLTQSGTRMGTPSFMPRQQVVNFKDSRPEVDVWAMAASLYFMLTGRPPRNFPEGVEWFLAVLESNAVPIRKRKPEIPKKLAEVIDRALVDKPEIGIKSAAELKKALEAAL